jgi:hypothetical protein
LNNDFVSGNPDTFTRVILPVIYWCK